MIKENRFIYECICKWSKDNKYGFIPHTDCPVHGLEAKQILKKSVNYEAKKKGKKALKRLRSRN